MATARQIARRKRGGWIALLALMAVGMLLAFSGFALADEGVGTTTTDTTVNTTDPVTTTDQTTTATEETTLVGGACVATGLESLARDSFDYDPEATVHLTGTGFAPGCDVVIKVTRPDLSVVTGDGSFTPGSDTVKTDEAGGFAYDYILDGVVGQYFVQALGAGDAVLAETAFLDSIPGAPSWTSVFSDTFTTKTGFIVRGDAAWYQVPVAPPNLTTYRYKITAPFTSACLTPQTIGSSTVVRSDPWQTTSSTPIGPYALTLVEYSDVNCTAQTASRTYSPDGAGRVLQAWTYDNATDRLNCDTDGTCGVQPPLTLLQPGDSAYTRVRNFGATGTALVKWIKPDTTIACQGTVNLSTDNGQNVLDINYPTPGLNCPAIGTGDVGLWKLYVNRGFEAFATFDAFIVVGGVVTSSSLCTFDVDPGLANDQFRLIFPPDGATGWWKLNASNPGQFYFNVFTVGSDSVTITIPTPFETQGAVPVHVYDGATAATNGAVCYTPGNEVTGVDIQTDGDTITVSGLGSGFRYIAVHLDYGFKGRIGYAPSAKIQFPDAIKSSLYSDPLVPINNNTAYTFGATGLTSATIYNENVFKNDPGIGGLVLTSGAGDPLAGTTVQIWQGTKLLATVQTDADGWYMWTYKYTGKAATFTVKLPAYSVEKTITLKSNGYVVVSFTV